MSRIGKKPVPVPGGVEVSLNGQALAVKGPKGEMSAVLSDLIAIEQTDDGILVSPKEKSQAARSFWGLSRSTVANLVAGVSEGFEKKLELQGVGYRAQIQGQKLKLSLGFSHDVDFAVPEGIKVECPSQTEITVSGIDKQPSSYTDISSLVFLIIGFTKQIGFFFSSFDETSTTKTLFNIPT